MIHILSLLHHLLTLMMCLELLFHNSKATDTSGDIRTAPVYNIL